MSTVKNPNRLVDILSKARTEKVIVHYYTDSNGVTFGGWQIALPNFLRQIAPICGYGPVNFTVNNASIGTASALDAYPNPRSSLGSAVEEMWIPKGTSVGGTAHTWNGAPSTHTDLYAGFGVTPTAYLASGVTASTAGLLFQISPTCGLDVRDELKIHLFDITFDSGSGHIDMRFRLDDTPYTSYGDFFNIPTNTGSIGHRQTTYTIVESAISKAFNSTSDVSVANDTIGWTAHGKSTGYGPVVLTGTLPTGLSTSTDYWIIASSVDTVKFATSYANAIAGTAVNITATVVGTGNITTATRDKTKRHAILFNYNPGGNAVGPHYLTGCGIEVPNQSHGFAFGSGIGIGGRASAMMLDVLMKDNGRGIEERLRQNKLMWSSAKHVIVWLSWTNDQNTGHGASHQYHGYVASGTSNTVVLDSLSIDPTGMTISITPFTYDPSGTTAPTTSENVAITGWDAETKTATIGSTWTRTPQATDVWRIGPLCDTQDGYYYNLKAITTFLRQKYVNAGLIPTFVIVPPWQPTTSPNALITSFIASAFRIALENTDVVAVATEEIMSVTELEGVSGFDTVHPGGHALSALVGRIVGSAFHESKIEGLVWDPAKL